MVDDAIEPAKKKRRAPVNLANMTVKWLEARGWCAGIVERRFGKFNHDYKGCVDIIALKHGRATLGVQVFRGTSAAGGGALAEHREKLLHGVIVDRKVKGVVTRVLDDRAPKGCRQILLAGGMVLLFGWAKQADRVPGTRRREGREIWGPNNLEWIKLTPDLVGLVALEVAGGEGEFE